MSATPVPCSAPTSATSTTTVHTRASISTHPTTTQTWSSRSTHQYGEDESSASWSTSTHEPPDPTMRAQVKAMRRVLAPYSVAAMDGLVPGAIAQPVLEALAV